MSNDIPTTLDDVASLVVHKNQAANPNKMTTPDISIINGHAINELKTLPDQSVQTCVTSPPYFGLRDYGTKPGVFDDNSGCAHDWNNTYFSAEPTGAQLAAEAPFDSPPLIRPDFRGTCGRQSATCRKCGAWMGQLGLEKSADDFVRHLVSIFRQVHRVLRDDGTLWLNLGDTVKKKQMLGIPWRVAFALQNDGWYLRQDIIWHKPNAIPESVRDRCTKAHEYLFLLTKNSTYYFDSDAIRNPPSAALIKQVVEGYAGDSTKDFANSGAQDASGTKSRIIKGARKRILKMRGNTCAHPSSRDRWEELTPEEQQALGSNKRSVWNVATKPFKGAHFATFPPDLIRPCIRAGARLGDLVLDPFAGSGTTGQVALEEKRKAILIELNPDYLPLIEKRLNSCQPTEKLAA